MERAKELRPIIDARPCDLCHRGPCAFATTKTKKNTAGVVEIEYTLPPRGCQAAREEAARKDGER